MKKIVLVDDNAEILTLMSKALSPPYQVLSASDGIEGLELVRRESPDLVVLDLLMPRMHGFEVCKRIKEDARLGPTKVLITSSKSYRHDIDTASGVGADSYIVKPFELDAFRAKVAELLGDSDATAVALRFWGTRGSIPAPGSRTQRYGGNTACTELRVGGQRFIIDAGTGLRELGEELKRQSQGEPLKAHMLIGHTHWDHIQGLPFFAPMYEPRNHIQLYGVHGATKGFEDALQGQMSPTYFPVQMKEMGASLQVHELSGPLRIGKVVVSYHYLNHPGVTVGFRLETPRGVICYLSDHEPYAKLNNRGQFSVQEDADIAAFVHGADLLISEAQYSEDEYRLKKNWGHSTFTDVIGLAVQAEVKQLALFHHDPSHTDDMMDSFLANCRAHIVARGWPLICFAAQEGQQVVL